MAYLINIGSAGTNAANLSGVGSRGYHIFRRGRTVNCRWAGIQVTPRRQFLWTRSPAEKRFVHSSAEKAADYLSLRLHIMTRVGAGYSVLPVGCRIHPRALNPAVSRKRVAAKRSPRDSRIRRAISIRQPLVELILRGVKLWEFRSQPTNIRERVYLYASMSPFEDDAAWKRAGNEPGDLPTGAIIGSVEIVDCVETSNGEYKYKLASPRRVRSALKPRNQPQPRFWLPKF